MEVPNARSTRDKMPTWPVAPVSIFTLATLALGTVLPTHRSRTPCTSALDCSLNGECDTGVCVCDRPWGGPACGALQYATTPSSGKSLFPLNKSHNTWNVRCIPLWQLRIARAYMIMCHRCVDNVLNIFFLQEKHPAADAEIYFYSYFIRYLCHCMAKSLSRMGVD